MTKKQLTEQIAKDTGLKQWQVHNVVNSMIGKVRHSLKVGERVELRGLGTFEPVTRKPRVGRNPRKPENDVPIPERRAVKFKPSKFFHEEMNQQ